MPKIQLTAIEKPGGNYNRGYVRAFGYRVDDARQRAVEVQLSQSDATDIVTALRSTLEFPQVIVEPKEWCFVLNVGELPLLTVGVQR